MVRKGVGGVVNINSLIRDHLAVSEENEDFQMIRNFGVYHKLGGNI